MTRPSKQSLRLFLGSLGVGLGTLAGVLCSVYVSNPVVKVVIGGVFVLVCGGFLLASALHAVACSPRKD
jgi:hypothetical protein